MLAERVRRDIEPLRGNSKVKTLPFFAAPWQNIG